MSHGRIHLLHNSLSRGQIARRALREAGADFEQVPVDWQIVPSQMASWLGRPDGAAMRQVFMPMKKLNMAALAAVAGS